MNILDECLRSAAFLRAALGRTDGQLLEAFVARRDQAAFDVLVRRHGPMVLGVCRRVLRNGHDAEDAFQATFLVFVRKAASIVSRELLANWLYGVAHNTALKARAGAVRRRGREKQVTVMPECEAPPQAAWPDLQPVLDEELSRLPEKYRAAVVLCDLQGKTRKEAARYIGCPEGSLSSRLARARALLAKRLARRGLTLSCASLAAALSRHASASLPAPLVLSTTAAAGAVSARVAALTEGVLRSMLLIKVKTAAVGLLLFLSVAGFAAGALACWPSGAERPRPHQAVAPRPDGGKVNPGELGAAVDKQQPDEELRRLIGKALKAHGGEAKLRRLVAFTLTLRGAEAQAKAATTEYFVQLPDHFRIEFGRAGDAAKDIQIILGLDGIRRWKKYGDGKVKVVRSGALDYPPEYWRDQVNFFGPRAVLRLKDPAHRLSLLAETKVGDRAAGGIGLTRVGPPLELSLKMYFDQETGLLLKEEDNLRHVEILYSDYKSFAGVPVAGKITRRVKGQVTNRSEVVEFRGMENLDPKLFQEP